MAENDDIYSEDSVYKDMENDLVQAKMQSKLLQLKIHLLETENTALLHELEGYRAICTVKPYNKKECIILYDAFWKNDWRIKFSESDIGYAKGGISMTTNIEFDNEAFDFTKDSAIQLRDYLNAVYP